MKTVYPPQTKFAGVLMKTVYPSQTKFAGGIKRRDEHREGNEKNDEGAGCINMGK